MVATTLEQQHEDADLKNAGKKKINKHLSLITWKQAQTYQRNIIQEQRRQRNKCKGYGSSKFCQWVSTRDCQVLTEEQRKWGFGKIWAMNTWERRLYVTTLVTKVNTKQQKVAEGSQCNWSLFCQLKVEDATRVKVCKALFSSALGLPERTITKWLNVPIDLEKTSLVNQDLRVESSKMFNLMSRISLRTGWRICPVLSHSTAEAQLPTKTWSSFTQARPSPNYIVNINRQLWLLDQGLLEENYNVFIAQKDQCVCVSFKHGNTSKAAYHTHVTHDKDSTDEESVKMDSQAVLLCPKTQMQKKICEYVNTHKGYKVLPFGVLSDPAMFQWTMEGLLQGIPHFFTLLFIW